MANVSMQVVINQPVEKVFEYVTNVANHLTWHENLLEAHITPEGPLGVGSTYHYVTSVMGNRIPSQMQISAWEENRVWGITTTGVPNPAQTLYTFDGAGDSTTLTIEMELTGGYPAAAEAMIMQEMKKQLDGQGQRIKNAVE